MRRETENRGKNEGDRRRTKRDGIRDARWKKTNKKKKILTLKIKSINKVWW